MTPPVQTAAHPMAILLLMPFIAVFIWAGWTELRRWWRHGPAEDRRSGFEIDETAPGYEPPPDRATHARLRP